MKGSAGYYRQLVAFLSRPAGRLVIRNFFTVAVANGVNRALKFLYLAYLARVLGAEYFGIVSLGYRAVLFFVALADFGLSLQGGVEVAKRREEAGEYIGSIGILKLGFSLVACLLFVGFGLSMGRTVLEQRVLALFAPLVIFSEVAFDWPLQGLEQMHHVAISRVLNGVLGWVLVHLLVSSRNEVIGAPVAMGLAGFASVLYLVIVVKAQPTMQWGWNPARAWAVLGSVLPLGISVIVLRLYNNLDIILLGAMGRQGDVGLYQAVYMIPQFLWTLGLVLMAAAIPPLARLARRSFERARRFTQGLALIVAGVTLLLGLVGGIFAPWLLTGLYGEDYVRGTLAFQLLLAALPLGMARTVLQQALPVFGWQRWFLTTIGAQIMVKLVLNVVLIRSLGLVGPAVAVVASEVVGVFGLVIVFQRDAG
jgi:O-antigen/teichoic acid export membrane protein